MSDDRLAKLLRGLRTVLDDVEPSPQYVTNGPLRVRHYAFRDDKNKERRAIVVESGWDHNYGGKVEIVASPTGKSLSVSVSPEVKVGKFS